MDPSKNPDHNRTPLAYDEDETNMDDSYLSEMIDGVFERPEESDDRFDMDMLNNTDATLDPRHYDERDYQSHRRESFPQTHHPLRPLHSRSNRKKHVKHGGTTGETSKEKTPTSSEVGSPLRINPSESDTRFEPGSSLLAQNEEAEDELTGQESSPLIQYELESLGLGFSAGAIPIVTPHPTYPSHGEYHDLTASPPKKVQFEIGGSPVNVDEEGHERRKHSHRRHHPKYFDPQRRLRQGSDMSDTRTPVRTHGLGVMPENLDMGTDIPLMADLDKDDLTDHRFADNKGYRRHKFQSKFSEEATQTATKPTKYDHQPHEIFVELDVLSGHGEHREWKETARWIKYEEDVEEGADRWGRPHVASLSFHSLINLRRLIETGVTLLDLEERDLPGISYRVVEAMVVKEMIRPEDRAMMMRALLLKHRHVNENESGGWRFNLRRNTNSGSLTSLHANAMLDDKNNRNKSVSSPHAIPEDMKFGRMSRRSSASSRLVNDFGIGNGNEVHRETGIDFGSPHSHLNDHRQHPINPQTVVDISKLSISSLSEEEARWAMNKEGLLRRIPIGAEASVVLVGKEDKLKRPILGVIRLAESSYMPNITELPIPVRFLYVLLGPSNFDLDYKEIGRSISTLMSNRHFHEIAYKAHDRKDLLKGIHDFLDESIVLPPGDWDDELFPFEEMREKSMILRKRKDQRRQSTIQGAIDSPDGGKPPGGGDGSHHRFDPLQRSKRLFGGMMNDIKRRYPLYLSDIKDGFNLQILASIIFIYFAAVSGAIAFGGILGEKTEKHIGISETLIASSAAGLLFSVFSGQPLLIIGTTGPLLLFDESLYKICQSNDIDFLAFRFWIGIWVMVIGMLVVCFDGSCIARYFTRFVQEIFASMIALLFIFDALNNLLKVYQIHPLQFTYGNCSGGTSAALPNTALLSSVLCIGTFVIAYSFRLARTSGYFTPMIRNFLGNFGVPIAILLMVGLDYALKDQATTEKLKVPEGLQNTKVRMSWIVDMTSVSIQMALLAAIPAFLVFILMFMETCICSLIVGKKEMKLNKGGGFHVDIFIICLINGMTGTIGGCWVCAATVRAVAHTASLTVFSTNDAPGEKPRILGVKEQRVSNFVISLLVGLSVLMSPALLLIPMAVLFGVFLYMGVSSMTGIQFFERFSLLFKQVANHPQVPYVRRVRTSKMHLYTVIQAMCLVMLFGVRFSPIALAIPFLLILLIPLRTYGLKAIFKPSELASLDAKGLEPDEEEKGPPEPPNVPVLMFKQHNLKEHIDDSNVPTVGNARNKEFRSIW